MRSLPWAFSSPAELERDRWMKVDLRSAPWPIIGCWLCWYPAPTGANLPVDEAGGLSTDELRLRDCMVRRVGAEEMDLVSVFLGVPSWPLRCQQEALSIDDG